MNKTPGRRPLPPPSDPQNAEAAPRFRSHFIPRTRAGWTAVLSFLGLFAFTQPPLVFLIGNRIEPRILGVPFFYVYLLAIYVALIGVLIWAQRKGV
jgi:hypothetical protein